VIPTISPPSGGRTPRVLCVDDNPDQADSEALFLRILGFEARACYGGRDAIILAGAFLPDVCLLDMSMPGMEGDELAARLRVWAGGRPLVLVAVTAACTDTPAAGFDRHLLKPVDPGRLLAVVNALTSERPGENGRSLTTDTLARPVAAGSPVLAR
jgi:two-component system, OmpR family, response regulator